MEVSYFCFVCFCRKAIFWKWLLHTVFKTTTTTKIKIQKPISLSELVTVMLGSWNTGPAAHERMKVLIKWLS